MKTVGRTFVTIQMLIQYSVDQVKRLMKLLQHLID